jgi:hypothetical protein
MNRQGAQLESSSTPGGYCRLGHPETIQATSLYRMPKRLVTGHFRGTKSWAASGRRKRRALREYVIAAFSPTVSGIR